MSYTQNLTESTSHSPKGYSITLFPSKSANDSLHQPTQFSESYTKLHNEDEYITADLSPQNTLKKRLLKHQYTLLKIKPCSGEYDDEPSLDKGWLKVYQVWLALFVVSLVGYSLFSLINLVNNSETLNMRHIAFTLYLFFFVIIEFQAILQKDINKARLAIWGFKGFMGIFLIIQLVFVISYPKSSFQYFAELVIGLASFYISVFMGANKVFTTLQDTY
jgi:hypothetical protein